jgi:succinyl-diaminopimelate desuccinylase
MGPGCSWRSAAFRRGKPVRRCILCQDAWRLLPIPGTVCTAHPCSGDRLDLAALDALHLDDGNDAFQPSNLEITNVETSNGATNVIPGTARIQLNIRFNNLHTGEDLVALVRRTAEEVAPGSQVEAKISGEAFLTPPGPLYDIVTEAIRAETGVEPRLSTHGGTSDGRFLIELCPVIDFGLPNATMHKLDEAAAIEDIHALSRIYARVIRSALSA